MKATLITVSSIQTNQKAKVKKGVSELVCVCINTRNQNFLNKGLKTEEAIFPVTDCG